MKAERYVVAVSGGIDSMVLLDALVHEREIAGRRVGSSAVPSGLIVAHFDHGIRADSADDAAFVRAQAQHYGLEYVEKREELGAGASEERARQRRYAFLREICRHYNAHLMTAHHADDIVETIAINCTRGTGWRGLAVLAAQDIHRPLLGVTKAEIRTYATHHHLQWREDSTNMSDAYLRNRLRRTIQKTVVDDTVWQLAALRDTQVNLADTIDILARQFAGDPPYSRYFLSTCGDAVADEVLRMIFVRELGQSLEPPMRRRLLHAVKTARAGTRTSVAKDVFMRFTPREFIVERTP